MSDPLIRDIPDVELTGDLAKLKPLFEAIKESLQVGSGFRKQAADSAWVRKSDLMKIGLVDRNGNPTAGGSTTPGPPGPPGSPGGTYVPDLTAPPTPTGLDVTAGITFIYVTHDNPTYTVGHGHDRTLVFGAKWPLANPTAPTFGDAVPLFDFQGTIGAYPTEPATRWCIWIKWRTIDGGVSVSPAGGTNGDQATTGQDVSLLLTALTGQITESQLFATLGARINLIDGSGAGSVNARIATETTNRTTADSALSSTISTLSASVGTNTAAISTEASARASADGLLQAQYTVKVDINGYVSGFGLASTNSGAAPTSSFIVRADSFAVASPTGPGITPVVPFIVRTTPGSINGVAYPAGVYIDSAYILDLTAAIARLGNAWIDDAKIANLSAAKLTAGSGVIGGDLKSSNYVAGVSGWIVRPSGFSEFDILNTRGSLTAGRIDTRGLSIKDLAGNVILAAGTALRADLAPASGTNLLYNPAFDNGIQGWAPIGGVGIAIDASGLNLSAPWQLLPYGVAGGNVFFAHQTGRWGGVNGYYEWISSQVPVEAGKRYIVSAYTGAHRCSVVTFLRVFNAAGTLILDGAGWGENNAEAFGGNSLSEFKRTYGAVDMPVGASHCHVVYRKYDTLLGEADSYLFVTRLMLEQAGTGSTVPGPWADSGLMDRSSVRSGNPITAATASTYIASAAIGTAQIANLAVTNALIANAAVDTLQVAGNAITAPGAASLVSDVSLSGSPTTPLSVSIDPGSSPVWVQATIRVRCTSAISSGICVLTINASVPAGGGVSAFGTSVNERTDGMQINDTKTIAFGYYDNRGSSGARSYSITGSHSGGGALSMGSGSVVFGIGVKR